MRTILSGRLLLCALFLPFASYGSSYYLVTTGQATANTQLDVSHDRTWSFAPVWNWDLGGGDFTIKRGVNTGVDAVLTLHLGSATGAVLASAIVSPTVVTTSYNPVAFYFSDAVTLSAGNQYSLVLTSATADTGSTQYFIKGGNDSDYAFQDGEGGALPETDPSSPQGAQAPEPASMSLAGASLLAVVWASRKLRSRE